MSVRVVTSYYCSVPLIANEMTNVFVLIMTKEWTDRGIGG